MTFRIGQKVIAVYDGNSITPCVQKRLTVGAIYTIRDVDSRLLAIHGQPTVRVDEVINVIENGWWEPGYQLKVFRPVVDKQTDISFAHEILRKATKKERA